MLYREIPIYDDPFPTQEQIMSGNPTAPRIPDESWLKHVQPGETVGV